MTQMWLKAQFLSGNEQKGKAVRVLPEKQKTKDFKVSKSEGACGWKQAQHVNGIGLRGVTTTPTSALVFLVGMVC